MALKTFELLECEIYTSCEPCPMCLGAIYWARLARIFFASAAGDAAAAGFDDSLIYREIPLPHEQRVIPMIPMMREQALEAFRAWQDKSDKIVY
jgi:tRNA(Arg) A34 adenosine deaminase TadA